MSILPPEVDVTAMFYMHLLHNKTAVLSTHINTLNPARLRVPCGLPHQEISSTVISITKFKNKSHIDIITFALLDRSKLVILWFNSRQNGNVCGKLKTNQCRIGMEARYSCSKEFCIFWSPWSRF